MIKYRNATNVAKTIGIASAELLPPNENRKRVIITNGHATQSLWVSFGEAAVIGKGCYLAPNGGSLEIPPDELYVGQINGIASGAGTTVGVVEFY